ncbi:MAG: hypothetical protein ACOYLV_15340 [Rubrivivax sp.]
MRTLVAALVLANAAFFLWANGWLSPLLPAPWQGQREPERLREQVRPGSVAVARTHASLASQPAVREAPAAAASAAPAASNPR